MSDQVEIERIRARLDESLTPDDYERHGAEPHPRVRGALRGTQDRDVLLDLRTLLDALDAERERAQSAEALFCRGIDDATRMLAALDRQRAEAERLQAELERIGAVLLEPAHLPEGMPPLTDRIVAAIGHLYRERTRARTEAHEAVMAERVATVRIVEREQSAAMACEQPCGSCAGCLYAAEVAAEGEREASDATPSAPRR